MSKERVEAKSLFDYITQLQQENKELNEDIIWWTNRFKAVERDNKELKQRIDKAIEYIKEHSYLVQDKELNGIPLMSLRLDNCYDLLEILGDKENEWKRYKYIQS